MGQPQHRNDQAHVGLIPAAQLAAGTATPGNVVTIDPTTHVPTWDVPAAIPAGSIPLTALVDQATDTFVGRVAAGAGPPSALSAADTRAGLGLPAIANPNPRAFFLGG